MGQLGTSMKVFCSERCRTSAWLKAGESPDEHSHDDQNNYVETSAETESRGPSMLLVSGAEYEYSAKTAGVTMILEKLENKSAWVTGKLRLELFLSKEGPYSKGARLSGTTLAVSNSYAPLRRHYSYSNMKTVAHLHSKPKSGMYTPILLIRELCTDGEWHIAGYVNFPQKLKWS